MMPTIFILTAWVVLSVITGLVVGPLLGRMSDLYPPAPPDEKTCPACDGVGGE
jgi:hypothetical protein